MSRNITHKYNSKVNLNIVMYDDVQCKFIPKVWKSELRKQSPQGMNKAKCKS